MIPMAVMAANKKSRSFSEAAAGRKDLYLTEGPAEEADVIYLPDYSSLDFQQVLALLRAGKHVLFGAMGAADAGSLRTLAQTADEHGAVLLEHIHLGFNPCMAPLKTAVKCLGPIRRIRLHSCEYAFTCKGIRSAFVHAPARLLPGGALFQRGLDCIYPLVHLFGIPEHLDARMVFTENGMDAAGAVSGYLGAARVELVYSKISGSHVPSLIEGEKGSLLIRDIQNFREVTYFNRFAAEEPLVSFSDKACRSRELEQCMEYIEGKRDWRRHLATSFLVFQMMDEIRGCRNPDAGYRNPFQGSCASAI